MGGGGLGVISNSTSIFMWGKISDFTILISQVEFPLRPTLY